MTLIQALEANKETCCMMSDELIETIFRGFTQEKIELLALLEISRELAEEVKNRTCESCKYHGVKHCKNQESIAYTSQEAVYEDDGCNKWEQK